MTDDQNLNGAPLQPDQKGEGAQAEKKGDPSDSLTPDHPRFKQVLESNRELTSTVQALKDQLSELNAKIEARQDKTGDDDLTEEERAGLARIESKLRAKGAFVTKEDLDRERRIANNSYTLDRLGNKYDGTNGYPKFNSEDVIEHAKRKGIGDFEEAYYSLHREAITKVEAKRLNDQGSNPPNSEKPTGGADRNIGDTKLTPEAVANMSDAEYEQNRDKILQSMKASAR